ncbi:MAG: arsenite methyltransferase [Candidatus Bipolaricaulis sp.]|nr:arsenite methyltransferase [Candidatus Bipolaricaulis sp.]
MNDDGVRKAVRTRYGERAKDGSCGCSPSRSCCGGSESGSERIGYSKEELRSVPAGADLGLGCGNPTALASLRSGEVVLDLGSGAGIDCFLAAEKVGPSGRAIGVDMTPEMVDRARETARQESAANVEFRLGEIEHLPVADASVDVVISNCVVNLSPDKPQVFREAYRVLKPGGRMFLSDIVLMKELPRAVRESIEAYVGCVAGASLKADYLAAIYAAGFRDVEVVKETSAEAAFGSRCAEPTFVVDGQEVDPADLGLTPEAAVDLAACIASVTVKAAKAPSAHGGART